MSSTLKAGQTAAGLREQGFDVIDLTLGEPDFQTPEFIKEFAWEGLQKGLTKYTPTAGLKSFTEAIAHFYAEQFGARFRRRKSRRLAAGNRLFLMPPARF